MKRSGPPARKPYKPPLHDMRRAWAERNPGYRLPRRKPQGRARPGEALAVWCGARIEQVCTGRAEHRHHIVRRSQGGGDDATNTLDLCRACHGWVHANPAAARALGLLGKRTRGEDAN